jgi:hypothetical protein
MVARSARSALSMLPALLLLLLLLLAGLLPAGATSSSVTTPLFTPGNASGSDCIGTRCFVCWRIPALAGPSASGRLFAFAEARDVPGCDDHGVPGAVVLAVKTSDDLGRSWSTPRQVARVDTAGPGPYGRATGNPSPLVFHGPRPHIELVFSVNNLEAWSTTSTDDGESFSPPRNRTLAMKPALPHRNWWASGPPGGVVLPSGRAIFCANIEEPVGHPWSFAVWSDDGAATWNTSYDATTGRWRNGGRISLFGGSGECQIARFGPAGAHLAMLVRSEVNTSGTGGGPSLHSHAIATSTDSGETWVGFRQLPQLPGVNCQGSIVGLPPAASSQQEEEEEEGDGAWSLAVTAPTNTSTRANLTLFVSADTEAWSEVSVLFPGPAAYSSLLVAPAAAPAAARVGSSHEPLRVGTGAGGALLCAYERGDVARFGWGEYSSELVLAVLPVPRPPHSTNGIV